MESLPSLSTLWAILASIAAVLAGSAAFLLWRAHQRITHQAHELADDVGTLNDRLWALADSEERYRSLIEAQGDLIVRRKDGHIIYANAAYAALLGTTETEVVGGRAEPLLVASRPAQALEDGSRVFDECVALPEGGERWISWVETVVPVALGKTVLQRVGRDISARIAGEQALMEARSRAESVSEAKSRFLATVSHEFRTPLNGILGMADLLNDTRLDPEQTTYVRALRTSGESLLSLVDDILDFAKAEAGKLELAHDRFDLGLLIEMVSEFMAPRAQVKGIEIATYLAPSLPSHLIGDSDRLRQILLNLVGNAVKFTERGGIGIRVEREDGAIAITVADTGPGIPQERLQAIFEEFEQADQSAARRHDGTGLGLAIVRRLVALMGGEVTVASELGHGSTFKVVLPLTEAEDSQPSSQPPDWHGKRMLIVAATPFGAPYLAETVGNAGAAITLVRDEAAALEALAQGPRYDTALIDQEIGDRPARALAAAVRKAGVLDSLIVLSPYERRQFGSPRAAGFTGFLVKPVRARSLYERLSPAPLPGMAEPAPVFAAVPMAAEPAAPQLIVLVAEDNEINALLATRTLERMGCAAIWARDGREAVALAEAGLRGTGQAFDLVLLDIRMPELDGLEAARLIRAAEAALGRGRTLPILALTANVAEPDRRAALSAGMDDCLAKPLERDVLRGWIDRVAGGTARSLSA